MAGAFRTAVGVLVGAPTEAQDLIEAILWNVVDSSGRPVLSKGFGEGLDIAGATKGSHIGFANAVGVKLHGYAYALQALFDGSARLDVGGALYDIAAGQFGDAQAAAPSVLDRKIAKDLGLELPVGPTGLHNQMRKEADNGLLHLPQEWSDALHGRAFWGAHNGFTWR